MPRTHAAMHACTLAASLCTGSCEASSRTVTKTPSVTHGSAFDTSTRSASKNDGGWYAGLAIIVGAHLK